MSKLWREGTIGIPDETQEGKYKVCHYWLKRYEEPSEEYGIDGGRISKLQIRMDDRTICNYDRGCDVKPTCREAELALAILLQEHQ